MSKKVGYAPGQGRTFTPSLSGKWMEEFNSLLEQEGLSRNALTEELIECGLKVKNHEHLFISAENLSSEQVALLSSKEGQQMLLNVALLLVGNPNNSLSAMFTNMPTQPENNEHEELKELKEEIIEDEVVIPQTEKEDKEDLLETLPERLITTESIESELSQDQSPVLTPQDKLRQKMRMLKQTKSDLKS